METLKKIFTELSAHAARSGDRTLLMILRKAVYKLEESNPSLAKTILSSISLAGGPGGARKISQLDSIPEDRDSGIELLHYEGIPTVTTPFILDEATTAQLSRFIEEREKADLLLQRGITPPNSLALTGPPGTGKTTSARWIAHKLQLPLFVLNLASVITSYLGQTGQNLSKALTRAKQEPSILLLDEFESIASLRTIDGDIGEMRRIVAVLLKEIEIWPDECIIIAASNLPELIDKAFIRRFSRWINIGIPDEKTKISILNSYLKNTKPDYIKISAQMLPLASGADLKLFSEKVQIREIMDNVDRSTAIIYELASSYSGDKKDNILLHSFIHLARNIKKKLSYRELSALLGISHTKVMQISKQSENNNA